MKKLTALFILCAASITVISAQSLSIQLSGSNITCYGVRDGSINLTVSGGTSPYTFEWSTGATTEDILALPPSYYAVTVTDAASNTATDGLTITEPSEITFQFTLSDYIVNGTHYNLSSYDWHNGSITTSVSGGVPGYTYIWTHGPTTANLSSLNAGPYKLIVTDASGCTKTSLSQDLTKPDRSDWQMAGNTNTDPNTQFIGTTDNVDLSFRTYNSERFRIKANGDLKINSLAGQGALPLGVDSNGKVGAFNLYGPCGIGTTISWASVISTSPWLMYLCPVTASLGIGTNVQKNKLDVLGGVAIGSSSYAGTQTAPTNGLIVEGSVGIGTYSPAQKFEVAHNTISGNPGGMILRNLSSGNKNSEIEFFQNSFALWSVGCDVSHNNTQNFFIWDNASSASRLHIDGSGNIGIGTTAPAAKLEVNDGNIYMNGENRGLIVDASDKRVGFIKYSGREAGIWRTTSQDFEIGRVNTTSLPGSGLISSDFTTDFYIDGNGKVGIGTTPPTTTSAYYLFVTGGIATRDIKVQATGWPDYIFNTSYQLMSIYELDQFIKQNKHLPGIPSAKEIEKNDGYELGDMVQKLLEKTEEQSLYIISLQKQMDDLKKEISNK